MIRNRFLLILSTLAIFGACQANESEAPNLASKELAFEVSADVLRTRTTIEDAGLVSNFGWEADDCLGFFVGNVVPNVKLDCSDANEGSFGCRVKLQDDQLDYAPSIQYYSYYPYQLEAGSDATALNAVLPSVQSAPFDGKSDFMVADPVTDYYNYEDMPKLSFSFARHLFAIVKLSVNNTSDLLAGERISSIALRSSGDALAGAFTFDATDPDSDALLSFEPEELSNSVSVCYAPSEEPVLSTGTTHTVYAVVNPGSFLAGQLELVVTTDKHEYNLATSSPVILSRNQVAVFPAVDLSLVPRLSNTNDLLSFSLNDGAVDYPAFEISESVVSVQVPNGTDLSNVKVYFDHNGASIKVNGVEQVSGAVDAPDFSSFVDPVVYAVTSENGETKEYTVRVFNLPIVFINTPEEIVSKEDWVKNCSFSIHEDDGTISDFGSAVQVKGRGNSTWQRSPKKALTLKLKNDASVMGMPADKRWNLLANYFDRTHLRNDICLEMAHRAEGLEWSSHGKFVELILNGEFVGTYYLCEHNKVSPGRVNITEMAKGDTQGMNITGGYLLEYDKNEDDDPQFVSSVCNYKIKIKSPDDSGFDAQWLWIENYINNLEQVLSNADSLRAHAYVKYIDVDSFVDWYFIHEVAGQNETNGPWSCYMYKDRGGKLKAGPVWDFDKTTFKVGLSGYVVKNNLYYKYLFNDPYFNAKIKERWPLFISSMSDLSDYIDNQISRILKAVERDKVMWPPIDDGRGTFSWNGDLELSIADACNRLAPAIQARMTELTTRFNALPSSSTTDNTSTEDFSNQDDQTGGFVFGF